MHICRRKDVNPIPLLHTLHQGKAASVEGKGMEGYGQDCQERMGSMSLLLLLEHMWELQRRRVGDRRMEGWGVGGFFTLQTVTHLRGDCRLWRVETNR